MTQTSPQTDLEPRRIPTIDVSAFFSQVPATTSDTQRITAANQLVEALHSFGFAKVIGHGLSNNEISEALGWVQKLFDLPYDEKMKAPHPAGPIPHRGYSGIGKEKVYSQEDIEAHALDGKAKVSQELRKVSDYKVGNYYQQFALCVLHELRKFQESYEIGSETDPVQQNIWLPEDVLPGFREYETALYERLAGLSTALLDIIGIGLGLESGTEGAQALANLISDRHCQLRLLHYPSVSKTQLQEHLLARLPPHRDWG